MSLLTPPVGFHFRVTFALPGAGEHDSRFQEVSGLSAELGVEELQEGGENRFVHRLPTLPRYGNLVLKRGLMVARRCSSGAGRRSNTSISSRPP